MCIALFTGWSILTWFDFYQDHVLPKYGVVWSSVLNFLAAFGARNIQEVYQHEVQRDGQIAMGSPGRLKCRRNHDQPSSNHIRSLNWYIYIYRFHHRFQWFQDVMKPEKMSWLVLTLPEWMNSLVARLARSAGGKWRSFCAAEWWGGLWGGMGADILKPSQNIIFGIFKVLMHIYISTWLMFKSLIGYLIKVTRASYLMLYIYKIYLENSMNMVFVHYGFYP